MINAKLLRTFATLVIVIGFIVMAPFVYFWNRNRIAQAYASPALMIPAIAPAVETSPGLLTGKPNHISIPAIHIDLPVVDGQYDPATRKWTLTKDKAHYALPSVQLNNKQGSTLIYAHSYDEVFGQLEKLQNGELVTVTTENGLEFTYRLFDTTTVNPTNVDIFAYKGKPRLTLQTCTGAYLQNRQFFYFELVSAKQL